MKTRKLLAFLVAICVMGLFQEAQAQKGLQASGGTATGNGSISYSVGQLVYSAYTGNNGSFVQGVQQPYQITLVDVVEKEEIRFHVSAYPNPTIDVLILDVSGQNEDQYLSYQIFNSEGSLLESNAITSHHQVISMEKFAPSTYFLKVVAQNNNQISKQTFQIIKI